MPSHKYKCRFKKETEIIQDKKILFYVSNHLWIVSENSSLLESPEQEIVWDLQLLQWHVKLSEKVTFWVLATHKLPLSSIVDFLLSSAWLIKVGFPLKWEKSLWIEGDAFSTCLGQKTAMIGRPCNDASTLTL